MNFKDEYKKSVDNICPDREALDRMKAAVLAKIADEQGQFSQLPENDLQNTEDTPRRKPLPFKRIALIGGAVAACAVVTISAVTLLPNLKVSNSMLATGNASSTAAMDSSSTNNSNFDMAEAAECDVEDAVSAADGADAGFSGFNENDVAADDNISVTTAPEEKNTAPEQTLPDYAISTEEAELDTYEEYTGGYHDGFTATGADESEYDHDKTQNEPTNTKDNSSDKSSDVTDNGIEPDKGEDNDEVLLETRESSFTQEVMNETVEAEEVTDDDEIISEEAAEATNDVEIVSDEATAEVYDESVEVATTDSMAAESEEAEPEMPKLVLTEKGWLTYDGVRYDLDSSVKTAMFPISPLTVTNVLDGKDYFIYADGYVLKVFDGQKNFLGLYRKRV